MRNDRFGCNCLSSCPLQPNALQQQHQSDVGVVPTGRHTTTASDYSPVHVWTGIPN